MTASERSVSPGTGWLDELWWSTLPAGAGRVSPLLPNLMTDGSWSFLLRPVATAGPALMLAAGMLIGWIQPGYVTVPTESLVLFAVMVGIGGVSGALGLWLLVGFVLSDFFVANPFVGSDLSINVGGWRDRPEFAHLWRLRPGMVLQYVLMALPLAVLPAVTKVTVAETLLRIRRLSAAALLWLMGVSGAVVLGLLVHVWSHATALLIRPRFTWFGRPSPTYEAIGPLQETAWVLAGAAAAGFAVRCLLQATLARRSESVARAAQLTRMLTERSRGIVPLSQRLPWPVRTAVMIGFVLFLADGVLESWTARAVAAAVMAVIALARSPLLPDRVVRGWGTVARIPLLLRLLMIGIVARVSAEYALARSPFRVPRTWTELLIPTLVALAVAVVLLPPDEDAEDQGTEPEREVVA